MKYRTRAIQRRSIGCGPGTAARANSALTRRQRRQVTAGAGWTSARLGVATGTEPPPARPPPAPAPAVPRAATVYLSDARQRSSRLGRLSAFTRRRAPKRGAPCRTHTALQCYRSPGDAAVHGQTITLTVQAASSSDGALARTAGSFPAAAPAVALQDMLN
ncbi:uncharacterized protein LOC126484692 [Schistocerca serialis cubense]|uniref:uncharacterized protein LOC126484692 n=1 Tax=Schistocerca serialis cubense TaxID=2023355 RepID=UPI00214EA4BC|nr:uncharacterized protein LOC126484692 [Schistocerca serialis cubense]